MMDWLRTHTKKIIWIIILAFMSLIFLAWGMQQAQVHEQNNKTLVAEVNGSPLPVSDFDNLYQQQVSDYRSALGDAFTDNMATALKPTILKGMIRQELLLQTAKKLGITVTPGEIKQNIKGMFSNGQGGLDEQKYKEALENPSINWDRVSENIKMKLTLIKVRQIIVQSASVTNAEVIQEYLRVHRRVKLEAVVFSPSSYAPGIKIYDREIADYYTSNHSEYETPETAKVRHILIMVKDKQSPASDKQAREKIEGLLKKIKAGESFEKLAKENSEDPGSAARGGDLGEIKHGVMVPEFEKAAFALKKNGLSPVVKTQFGYHIILCEGHKEGKVVHLAEARDKIRKILTDKKAMLLAGLQAQQFSEKAGEVDSKDWQKLAKDFGGSVEKTGWTKKDSLAAVLGVSGKSTSLNNQVLYLYKNQISAPLSETKAYYVVKIIEEQLPAFEAKAFEKEKDELHDRCLNEKQQSLLQAWQEDLEKQAKIVSHFKEMEAGHAL